MQTTKIITHPGQRHRDDFLAVCWLLGATDTEHEVLCKEPTPEELSDPETYVVDIGGRYEPCRRNFDHHQFPADHPPTCALQLLLENEHGNDVYSTFPWLPVTSRIDSRGLGATAKHYGTEFETAFKFSSPIEKMLLEQFAKYERMTSADHLFQTMRAIGVSMRERTMVLRECIQRVTVSPVEIEPDLPVMVAQIHVWRDLPLSQYFSEVMDIKRKELRASGFDPIVSISPNVDSRGPGWVLYRYDDNPKINFKLIEGDPRVTFAHANGFIAKVHPNVTIEDLKFLVSRSVVQQ